MKHKDVSTAWTESARLAALDAYKILDTDPEQAFDDIVRLTSQLLDAPIVAVNLIAEGRQWFKSEIGLGVREMPLDDSICKVAILQDASMIVPDTTQDPRFNCNPLVTGDPGLRFYAGALLKTPDGLPLGTLCVLDLKARPQGLSEQQQFILNTLAQQIQTQLELRKIVHQQKTLLIENAHIDAALRIEQDRTRRATDAAELGLWHWNPADDLLIWENRWPHEILGLSPTEAPLTAARFIRDYVHADDAGVFERGLAHTIETGARFYFVGRLSRPDRTLRWVEFFGQGQDTVPGTPIQVTGVVSDVTSRKLAERALYDSRERFQKIVSQAATGVVEGDRDGRITFVNQKYCEMLGYAEDELIGKNIVDITDAQSVGPTLDALQRIADGASGIVVEKRYRRRDGSVMWASSSVSGLRGLGGECQGVVAIVVDISERIQADANLKKLADDLAEADRRKTEFLATLAHELRNPLAPIRNGLSILGLRGDSAAAVGKIRAMMERQVGHMVHLIDDLLDIARISGDKVELKKAPVSVASLMASAVETSMPLIEAGRHQLVTTLPDASLMLNADPTRIAQVLANLLNNAAKYTPSDGHIEFAAHRHDSNIVITVADNGIGIPEESLIPIFDMFNQVGKSLSRAQGGLGIGLSLVHRLVEMHEGSVSAASGGIGRGSVFTVTLPLSHGIDSPSMSALPDHGTDRGRGRCLQVLVADDNRDAADTLSSILDIAGHTVRVAHDGIDAVQLANSFKPDVAFLDIGMPRMNGYDTARALRAMPGMEQLILIALTGWGDEHARARCKDAGFDHHVTKPVDMATVHALLVQAATQLTQQHDQPSFTGP